MKAKIDLTTSVMNPWLIQRCQIKSPAVEGKTVSECLRLEYMGSAEFECGIIPETIQALFAKAEDLRVHTYTESALPPGVDNLYFLALPGQAELYQRALKRLIEGKTQTKEYVFASVEDSSQPDLWMDLTNQIIFSTDFFFLSKFSFLVESSMKKISRNQEVREKGEELLQKELKGLYQAIPGMVAIVANAIESSEGTKAHQSRTKHDLVFWLNGPRLGSKRNWLCGFYTVEDLKEFLDKKTGKVQEAINKTQSA